MQALRRKLAEKISFNRVITIEPGVYIPASIDVPDWHRGIGIRIEDEALITDTGYEVLTGSIPKETQHIKSLLNYYCKGEKIEAQVNMRVAST